MYLNCLEQQNEFELDARSAKRAFEVSGVLHARLVLRGAAVVRYTSRSFILRERLSTRSEIVCQRQRIERRALNDARLTVLLENDSRAKSTKTYVAASDTAETLQYLR